MRLIATIERVGCVSVVLRLVMLAGATPPENDDVGIERAAENLKRVKAVCPMPLMQQENMLCNVLGHTFTCYGRFDPIEKLQL